MVAESLGRMVIHVDDAELRRAFKALQPAVVDAGIQAGWYALQVRMKVAYNVELQALSKALARADWLAHGGN